MFLSKHKKALIAATTLLLTGALFTVVSATHSWGNYHWARTANPFTLKLGDNVSTVWDAYLGEASSDWSQSSVLDTAVTAGNAGNPKRCLPTSGRVEVCSAKYGFNGWLGVASIWASGDHITQGTVKVNDSYFNTSTYNKPAWRRLVMCQEVGHTFGLDHQDENFSNPNLGTCMDYTDDPDGTFKGQLSNEHPNQHDYEELEAIYTHLDSITTVSQKLFSRANHDNASDTEEWGKSIRRDRKGRTSMYERDLGKGEKQFTFVFWAE